MRKYVIATALALVLSMAAFAAAQAAPDAPIIDGIGAGGMMMLDPGLARQRWDLGLKYAFYDGNLAARADWRSLRYESQNAMRVDLEKMKKNALARQNLLTALFRYYPNVDLSRVNYTDLGFTSIDELRRWIDSINDAAFKTNFIH
jgi:hypothetical protein